MDKAVDPVFRVSAWLLVAVLGAFTLKTLSFIFVPLSLAILICYALGIPLDLMTRYKVPRYLRIAAVVLAVSVMLYLLGRLVAGNVREFQEQLPFFEKRFWSYARWSLDFMGLTQDEAAQILASFLESFKSMDLQPVGSIVKKIGGSLFSFMGNLMWVVLFMVFILLEQDGYPARIRAALGEETGDAVMEVTARINRAVTHYLGLKTVISAVTGLLVALLLGAFGTPFAMLWGVLAFVLNFIPNIGSLISAIPPVAITLFHSGSPGMTLAVTLLLATIHTVVGNLVEPKVMGEGLDLSPLVVLLSLIFWGWMWGIAGMLISVPLTAAIKIAMEQVDGPGRVARLLGSGS